ncbi:peroxidase 18-like [Zingiber officinale]|uniref:Plant heme peroxidase family profile domain-containing protein n=1 Tax=Zingiber officinale TaxID=94328 RepID=A0A8J5KSY1_ZINOF|nr:peroxidase 18-like [Zingiber officinale]KAG6493862.1 hypothetical protein ZIOFF_048865 [Zingiber officinale]
MQLNAVLNTTIQSALSLSVLSINPHQQSETTTSGFSHSNLHLPSSFMNQSLMKLLLSTFVPLLLLSFRCASQLSPDFYSLSCPTVELLVRGTVRSASDLDSTIPGKLLRLLFHDCLVQGCDGSVLIQGNGTERSDPANKSLGAFYVVESAKRLLEMVCPGTVSCADTLVLAARDAV